MMPYVDLDFEKALDTTIRALNGENISINRAYQPQLKNKNVLLRSQVAPKKTLNSNNNNINNNTNNNNITMLPEMSSSSSPIKNKSDNHNNLSPKHSKKQSYTDVAGYTRFDMKYYWNNAKNVVTDDVSWHNFCKNPVTYNILQKQCGSKRKHAILGDIRSILKLNSQDRNSELITEVVAMVLKEVDQAGTLQSNDITERDETNQAIQNNVVKNLDEEELKRRKAINEATKSQHIRERISAIKAEKEAKIEEKRRMMIEKEIEKKKKIFTDSQASSYVKSKSEVQEEDIKAHQIRQSDRLTARMNRLKAEFDCKEERMKEFEVRSKQQAIEHEKELQARRAAAQGTSARAEEDDFRFRAKTADTLRFKQEKSEEFMTKFAEEQDKRRSNLRDRHELLDFRAAQRRRLMAEERKSKLDLLAVRQERLEASMKIKFALVGRRRQMYHQISETFHPQKAKGETSFEATPGPGDYDINPTRVIKGGKISDAGAKPSSIAKSAPPPGPGDYSPKMPPLATGAVPFQGRGKTYVDELVLREKKTPGPGYYNFGDKRIPGGKISQAKVPSQVELLMAYKRTQPGPGDYNISEREPKPMRTVMREYGAEEILKQQYPEL